MNPSWPKRIDGGQPERTWRNPLKPGFPESKSETRFWPGTKAGGNVVRRAVRPCFDQQPSNTELGHAETIPPPLLDSGLQVREGKSAAGKARSQGESTEVCAFPDLVLVWLGRRGRSVPGRSLPLCVIRAVE